MKFYFFDTSALVKIYHSEKGTDAIDSILAENDKAIVISSISVTEMVGLPRSLLRLLLPSF